MDFPGASGSGGMPASDGTSFDEAGYPADINPIVLKKVHKYAQNYVKTGLGKDADMLRGRSIILYPDAHSLQNPEPADFLLSNATIYIWSPSETYPMLCPSIECPKCGGIGTTNGWSQKVRTVTYFERSQYVYSRRYLCKPCNKSKSERWVILVATSSNLIPSSLPSLQWTVLRAKARARGATSPHVPLNSWKS